MVPTRSGETGAQWLAPAIIAVTAAMAIAAVPQARAADAGAAAITPADDDQSDFFVVGSATFPNDPRSAIAGRWNAGRSAFDWLWRIDAAPLALDDFTDVVATGGSVFGVGYANGLLTVAKLDPATGTLRRSCDGDGVATLAFDAPVLPGKAVALGDDVVVVGGTLTRPTRGVIAVVDGSTCALRASALVSAPTPGLDAGFTAVDRDADGDLLVSGFAGADAAVLRFGASLEPLALRIVDLGGTLGDAFADVRAQGRRALAVSALGPDVQCLELPALTPDVGCGTGGRRALTFAADGASAGAPVVAPLPSGNWLIAGAHSGQAGFPTVQTRAALAAYTATGLQPDRSVLAPDGRAVFDAFAYLPSAFTGLTASTTGIAGVGVSGYFPTRAPFLFSAGRDGARPAFTPLTGFDTAAPAPVEPLQPGAPAPPAASGPAPPAAARLATGSFKLRRSLPSADSDFGTLSLKCARACTARGTYRTPGARIGSTMVRIPAGRTQRIRLRLSPAGLRRLARAGQLHITVRFTVSASGAASETLTKRVTLRARRVSRSA
jgi:hypothetical protein